MENLWNFDEEINLENPVDIVKGQIEYLEEMTDKCVSAELVEEKDETDEFKYRFVINSPYMPNYSFKAFTIQCSPIFYPVNIDCDENIATELGEIEETPLGFNLVNTIICYDTDDFKNELKRILGTKYMKQVVAAVKLMAKSYL